MLSRKYTVQKSVRIDAKLQDDLELLSGTLGRSQNDLINFALELLMQDNRMWFAQNILVDECSLYLEGGSNCHVELGGVTIDLEIDDDDCSTTFSFEYKDENGDVIDKNIVTYPDDDETDEKIAESLKQIALTHLLNKPDIIEPYLKERLNYR